MLTCSDTAPHKQPMAVARSMPLIHRLTYRLIFFPFYPGDRATMAREKPAMSTKNEPAGLQRLYLITG